MHLIVILGFWVGNIACLGEPGLTKRLVLIPHSILQVTIVRNLRGEHERKEAGVEFVAFVKIFF